MTRSTRSGHGDDEARRRDDVERLFAEALALRPEDRSEFIERVCAGDAQLRAELVSLLDHAATGEAFFDRLAQVVIPSESPPGPIVGPYRILACVGTGGMGAVYRARDTRLNRDVALKFLPASAGAAPDSEERLLVEARAAASFEHPNVCTVHEIGATADGRPFIAMAFYEGETLKERLRRGPLLWGEAIDIATQIARGLGAAHAHGIVHRDVKPGNTMLTPDGTVKLLDFGLAKVADVNLTRPGTTPGTIAYMSPEQVRGDAVDARSDLWSLGVVLYEMLAGVHPFRGGNDRVLIQAILHDAPASLRQSGAAVPRSLVRVIERLLEKDAGDRYRSADELLADLATIAAGGAHRPAGAGVQRVPLRRRKALIAGTPAVVLGAFALGLWLNDRAGVQRSNVATDGTVGSGGAVSLPKTIAVLPFANLSRDAQDDDFSDGLAEELIGALSRVRTLRVAARTSAFAFKDQTRDIREIGNALNVGAIVEGSVRRTGSRIRVEARLIGVEDGLHLWSDAYDRELTDIFEIQRDLALNIARALRAELTAADVNRLGRRPTANADAFALYLKGRHFWYQRTPAGYQRAIEYFERAIAADPQFAEPHAGLGAIYALQAMAGAANAPEMRDRARSAVERALSLADDLAEAHAVHGLYLHAFAWDIDAAERELVRAVELDPGYATARVYLGNLLAATGRLDEAIAHKLRAVEVDPLAPSQSESLAFTLLRAGRPDEALKHVGNALELDSTYWRAHAVLGLYHELSGRFDDAIDTYRRANALAGATIHRTRADIARALALGGRRQEARRLIPEIEAEAATTGIIEPAVATALAAVGDLEAAFAWLERSYEQRHPHLPFITGDARFAALFDEARFTDLMRRVGMVR